MTYHTDISPNRTPLFFWSLVSLAAVLAGLYVYLVSTVIFDAVNRQKMLVEISRLGDTVTALETEYLVETAAVTLDLAQAAGFHEAGRGEAFFVTSGEPRVAVIWESR